MGDNGSPREVFDKKGQNKSLSNINRQCQTEILLYNICMDETLTSKSTDKISRRYIIMKLNEFVDYLKVLFEDEFVAKIEKNETDLLLTFLDGKQVKVSVTE